MPATRKRRRDAHADKRVCSSWVRSVASRQPGHEPLLSKKTQSPFPSPSLVAWYLSDNHRAGSAVVLHESSVKSAKWEQVKQTNPLLRKFAQWRQAYDESENELVTSLRGVTSTIGSWFEENETAQVTRMFREIDPSFNMEAFGRELREYIVPEIIDAYLSADREGLKTWCGEAVRITLSLVAASCVERAIRRTTFFGRRLRSISSRV